MPPKPRRFLIAPTSASSSRDVVAVSSPAKGKSRNEKPTTERALTLRNGKYGSMGTGEVALLRKMSGREKLELLAEDKMSSSLRAPFDLEKSQKIAQARLDVYLDDINNLQDPLFCFDIMEPELKAHVPPRRQDDEPDPMLTPSWVAENFGAHIHNTYLLASSWKIVLQSLKKLEKIGLHASHVHDQLRSNEGMRTLYLVVYDMVKNLVLIGQHRLRIIAQNTPHYAPFFTIDAETNPQDPQIRFDWDKLKTIYKSFVDSIVVEFCLPGSAFPLPVLFSCMHDSAEEAPEDLKRFPQAMWDAVGDLADAVQLLDLLETPLLTRGEIRRRDDLVMPKEFEEWEDAQIISAKASQKIASYKNLVFPLANIKSTATLAKIWRCINTNYIKECGWDIDALWQLTAVRQRTPQWRTYVVPAAILDPASDDSDDDLPGLKPVTGARSRPPSKQSSGGGKNTRLILAAESELDEPPPLIAASSSEAEDWVSEESDDQFFKSGEVEVDNDEYDDAESEYDTEEEFELRGMLREAMDAFHEMPEDRPGYQGMGTYAEERKKNPFLKLLGSLRGRMFSSSATIKTSNRNTTRHPYSGTKSNEATGKADERPSSRTVKPTESAAKRRGSAQPNRESDGNELPDLVPIQQQAPSGVKKTTLEEVEDEDNLHKSDKKKKKKKPKKKNKSETATGAVPQSPTNERPRTPLSPTVNSPTVETPRKTATPAPQPAAVKSSTPSFDRTAQPIVKTPAKIPISSTTQTPSISSSTTNAPYASNISLPLPHDQTAQSARSYLQSNANESKTKIKSRPDHVPQALPEKKKGLFSKLGGKGKEKGGDSEKSSKGFIRRLGKKADGYLRRIIGTNPQDKKGSLKWEQFLQVMKELGFEYDPSTAGSSVRFDPPDSKDNSITFHKPHPDPTLHPVMLRRYGKRLKDTYGWTEEKLVTGFSGFGAIGEESESNEEVY